MMQQIIIFLNKSSLFISVVFLFLVGCNKNDSKESDISFPENKSKKSSTVELAYFTISGLNLVTNRELMIKKFGEPNNEVVHRHELDTLHTIYYSVENTEIAFEQQGEMVFFSYLEFTDSSKFKFKNEYAVFSKETKFDPFKLLFHDSVKNASLHGSRKIITVKVMDRDRSWLRFEFEEDKLKVITLDTAF